MAGVFNLSAHTVPRVNETWSDGDLDSVFDCTATTFIRLQCRNCLGLAFEVLHTDDYETSARCIKCGMYYIVHTG